MPDPGQLRRFRAAVDDGSSGVEPASIVATLRKGGYEVGAHEVLKTAPKGYPKDHPRIELLNHKGIVMSKSWPVGAWLGTRKLRTAFAAVGLPVEPQPGDVPNVVAGQARGVVALWLAARGLDPADARRLASHHFNPDERPESPTPTPLDLGMAWPDPCSAGPPPVAWAPQDLAAARGLLTLPADRVHLLVLRDWDRFTDPAASSDELLAAAGVAAVGLPDPALPVPTRCPY